MTWTTWPAGLTRCDGRSHVHTRRSRSSTPKRSRQLCQVESIKGCYASMSRRRLCGPSMTSTLHRLRLLMDKPRQHVGAATRDADDGAPAAGRSSHSRKRHPGIRPNPLSRRHDPVRQRKSTKAQGTIRTWPQRFAAGERTPHCQCELRVKFDMVGGLRYGQRDRINFVQVAFGGVV